MVCGSCVQKLALRLVRNHKIDYAEALVRAEKGIERFENREKPTILSGKGNPSDYSQSCEGSCHCSVGDGCFTADTCRANIDCCEVCPSPLLNSHYVSDDCAFAYMTGCLCIGRRCSGTCVCHCTGACYYDCDEGFEWDGENCVPVVVPPAKPLINKPLVNPILVNPPVIRLSCVLA